MKKKKKPVRKQIKYSMAIGYFDVHEKRVIHTQLDFRGKKQRLKLFEILQMFNKKIISEVEVSQYES